MPEHISLLVAAALPPLLVNTGLFVVVVFLAFGALVLLTSYVRFESLARNAAAGRDGDLDPQQALMLLVAEWLGARRHAGFALVIIRVGDQYGDGPAWSDTITATLRASDILIPIAEREVAALIRTERSHVAPIVDRAFGALGPPGNGPRAEVRAGVATYPENGDRVAPLVEAARTALENVQAASGPGRCEMAPRTDGGEGRGKSMHQTLPAHRRQATLDEVTGVLKSERLMSALQRYLAPRRRTDRPVCLLCFDLAGFGRYTELYGKAGADRILAESARLLDAHVRADDLIARHGEHGFVAAVESTSSDGMRIANRVMGEILRHRFDVAGGGVKIVVACGIAAFPDHGRMAGYLLEYAQLAAMKEATPGKASVVMYDPERHRRSEKPEPVDAL